MVCKCVNDIEAVELMEQFADNVAVSVVDTFLHSCPEMMDAVVQNVVARLVHVQAANKLNTHEPSEEMYDLVDKFSKDHAKRAVYSVRRIIKERGAQAHKGKAN